MSGHRRKHPGYWTRPCAAGDWSRTGDTVYWSRVGGTAYRSSTGTTGQPPRPRGSERLVRLAVLRLGLLIAPVELLVVGGLLPLGISGGYRLIRRGTVSRLLRRWRIPRVIRHVAKSLFLYFGSCGRGSACFFNSSRRTTLPARTESPLIGVRGFPQMFGLGATAWRFSAVDVRRGLRASGMSRDNVVTPRSVTASGFTNQVQLLQERPRRFRAPPHEADETVDRSHAHLRAAVGQHLNSPPTPFVLNARQQLATVIYGRLRTFAV
jgi:hypothetical protein